ncbi:hypothetical protein EA462_11900 [Natrarchaeobius halalkaliphilus]|uniref:Solute carrier family 5 (Low affinity glucose cotransporter), member 4-like protein n=1 Tax=Natrarchaeobius halalkaliphilus TaxID=1679091 RepID=A0A3N6P2A8_9EURY|nr:hypothetical protein [Natrarchaeobius halalkaliphilus]RQG89285.1 hypothetical protein EA462_11900 [Natrarchaeobius halalkaliphilus]
MELSPEEYGAYWRASIRVAAGLVFVSLCYWFVVSPLLGHSDVGAVLMGIAMFGAVVFVGTFAAMLGLARVVRIAVDAEMRG